MALRGRKYGQKISGRLLDIHQGGIMKA